MLNFLNTDLPERQPSQSKVEVTIHENRAATDDSIRFANEMREKILAEIIGRGEAFVFSTSGEIFLQIDHLRCGINLGCSFKINGNTEVFKFFIKDHELRDAASGNPNVNKVLSLFAQAFADNLAEKMLAGFKFDQLSELLNMKR